MSLDEILNSASRHRIEAIIGNGARALDDIAERSRQLDKDWEKTRARQSEELKALEDKMKAAREAQQAAKNDEPLKRDVPKVRSLSLGAEELRAAGRAQHAAQQPPARPAPPPSAPPQPQPEVPERVQPARTMRIGQPDEEPRPKPARTMRIGAAEEDEPVPPPKPRPRREPRPDTDDDLSGRTWLR